MSDTGIRFVNIIIVTINDRGLNNRGTNDRGLNNRGTNGKGIGDRDTNDRCVNNRGTNKRGINDRGTTFPLTSRILNWGGQLLLLEN